MKKRMVKKFFSRAMENDIAFKQLIGISNSSSPKNGKFRKRNKNR